jgi:iron complex outermembrane receptor protein
MAAQHTGFQQCFLDGPGHAVPPTALHPVHKVCPFVQLVVLTVGTVLLSTSPGNPAEPSPAETRDTPQVANATNQGTSEELLFLQEETVSIAVQHEQPISESPSNVYVITDEDIRHSGATDIPTILRRIPGMEVMQMTGADFNVSVRGNNQTAANHLLVLVDGRPIYEYALSSVFWTLLPVTLPEIKKIEVWKGPASAIYGFNAFDGVVNIVTKSAQEMKGKTNGTFVQVGAGEFGTVRSTAIQAGKHGNFGYRLSFGHDQNQQWDNRDSLALRANKFNLQTEYTLKDNSTITFSGGLLDSNRWDGQVFDIVRESSKITNGYLNLGYERPNFFIRGSWTRWDINRLELLNPDILNNFGAITDRNGNIPENFTHDVFTLWSQHAIQISTSNRFSYGVNYLHNALYQANIITNDSAHEDRLGIYLQDEWRLADSLTLVSGVRWDLHSELNPTYSPRVSLIYKPVENHTFRISASIAYRPPSLLETNLDQRNVIIPFGVSFSTTGSTNLEAEKITSYEAGYQGWYWNHRLRIRGDLFFNHLSNFIGFPAGTTTFANLGQADIYGGEAGAELLATSWLTVFVNYATAQVHQTSDLVAAQGNTTRGTPPYKINAGLRGEWDNGLSGEILIHHVAAASYPISNGYGFFFSTFGGFTPPVNAVPSYTLLNLRGAYRFWHDRVEVAVSAFNALNDRHKENPVGETISSRVMGWLTLRY